MSWHTAARMPFILLAAIEAPTPGPQTMGPRAASAGGPFRGPLPSHGGGDVGEIHRLVVIGADVDDVMPEAADVVDDGLLERPAGVVGSDDETHVMPFLILHGSWQPRAAATIVSGLSYAYPAAARHRGIFCRSH